MRSGVYDFRKQLLTQAKARKQAASVDEEFTQKAAAIQAIASTPGYSAILWYLAEHEKTALDRLVSADDVDARAVANVCRKMRGFLLSMETAKEVEKTDLPE